MRFSLATLLLLALFAASLMAVWARWREPWFFDRSVTTQAALDVEFPGEGSLRSPMSPDRTRFLRFSRIDSQEGGELIIDEVSIKTDRAQMNYLFQLSNTHGMNAIFLSDNAISASRPYDDQIELYRRRFPEWWWGHFYRPEVWASLALGVALLVHAWRSSRRRMVSS